MVHHISDEAADEPGITTQTPSNDPSQAPLVYKVGYPPPKNLATEFTETLRETFFHDNPLRQYKGQSGPRRFMMGLEFLFPIFGWGRDYSLSKFKGDLIAGLTIASLCIPQDIGYSKLANLDPQYGLCSLLQAEVDHVKNKEEYMRLAFTATFFAGITQAALGFLRLGFLIEFLSHAAIVGFMGGAAITIALQQLKYVLGIANFTRKTDIVSVMESVWRSVRHGWNWQTIVIGVSFLVFLLFAKYIGKKNRKLFWVPAIAPIISVILATFFVYITRADKQGVQIVKHIEQGINPSSVHKIYFTGPFVAKGFKIGVVCGIVGLTEAVAIGRTFAAMKDYQLDGNKEMVALGTMNIVGSMTSCYVTTGSFSRSAVNFMAGCKTPVSNVVMSVVVLLTLLVITPLFKYTPNAILGSIIISAVIGLVDYEAAILIWKVDKLDFIACMGAFFGVVFVSVEIGLLIAVAISFAKILLQVTRPRTALLGNLPGTTIYRNISQYPEANLTPGVVIVRVDSAIYFSNSNYVRESPVKNAGAAVIDIDTSGIHALEGLYKNLQKRDMQLILSNPGSVVIEKLQASKLTEHIGSSHIFLAVSDAVRFCTTKSMQEPLRGYILNCSTQRHLVLLPHQQQQALVNLKCNFHLGAK
ncbi:High affinity sulfate transporter 1 [Triticum urartu]|uniref:High affinity sulfate transporter 1 n=1 Tax=Triticum urartu TaxID=4572 RepID=M7ZRV6_TRIUA|nr:High affinity sulfate transporter 1 [Triticum urartu]